MIEVTLTLEVVQLPGAPAYWCLRADGAGPVRSTHVAPRTDADLAALHDLDPAARTWPGVVEHLTPRASWSFNAGTLRQVGAVLWDRLFEAAPAMRDALQRVEARAGTERRSIRYVLTPIAADDASARVLEALPLELTAMRESGSARREFFFKRGHIPAVGCAPESSAHVLDLRGGARMLVATAHDDTETHPDANELAAHASAIAAAAARLPGWNVNPLPDATPDALRKKVTSGQYDVVYIACHGLEARDDAGALSLRGGLVRGTDLAGLAGGSVPRARRAHEARGPLRLFVGRAAPRPADRWHGPMDHPWNGSGCRESAGGDRIPRTGPDHLGLQLHGASL